MCYKEKRERNKRGHASSLGFYIDCMSWPPTYKSDYLVSLLWCKIIWNSFLLSWFSDFLWVVTKLTFRLTHSQLYCLPKSRNEITNEPWTYFVPRFRPGKRLKDFKHDKGRWRDGWFSNWAYLLYVCIWSWMEIYFFIWCWVGVGLMIFSRLLVVMIKGRKILNVLRIEVGTLYLFIPLSQNEKIILYFSLLITFPFNWIGNQLFLFLV